MEVIYNTCTRTSHNKVSVEIHTRMEVDAQVPVRDRLMRAIFGITGKILTVNVQIKVSTGSFLGS